MVLSAYRDNSRDILPRDDRPSRLIDKVTVIDGRPNRAVQR
jgi:hypothetical protein